MKVSSIREQVVEEVNQIPEEKLAQILDLIHHFRLGLQLSKRKTTEVTDFAGSWKDMPEEIYQDFIRDMAHRRNMAFSRRKNRGTDIG